RRGRWPLDPSFRRRICYQLMDTPLLQPRVLLDRRNMLAVSVSEMEMTDNAAPRHSGQWKKGQSGNPAGMPKGTRHRATMLAEKLMEDDAEDIVRDVVNAAKAGDPTAMRLCIERLAPLRKGRPITFDLPDIE